MAKSIDTNYRNIETHSGSGSVQDDPVRTATGIRESSLQQSMKDIGDARTLGPVKAAHIISPTREAKNFRWNTRKV